MRSPKERWLALVARGGPELEQVQTAIAATISRDGYISDEQVIELVLNALEQAEKGDEQGVSI